MDQIYLQLIGTSILMIDIITLFKHISTVIFTENIIKVLSTYLEEYH